MSKAAQPISQLPRSTALGTSSGDSPQPLSLLACPLFFWRNTFFLNIYTVAITLEEWRLQG